VFLERSWTIVSLMTGIVWNECDEVFCGICKFHCLGTLETIGFDMYPKAN